MANGRGDLAKTLKYLTGYENFSDKELDQIWSSLVEGTLQIAPSPHNHIAGILDTMNDLVPYVADRVWQLIRYEEPEFNHWRYTNYCITSR